MNLKVDDYIRIIKVDSIFSNMLKLKPDDLGQVVNIVTNKHVTIAFENGCGVFALNDLKNTVEKIIKPVITSDLKPGMKIRFRKDLEVEDQYNDISIPYVFFDNLDVDYTIESVDKEDDTILIGGFWVGVTAIDYAIDKQENEKIKDKDMKVVFSDRVTILFKDGKKFVAKCDPEDEFDKEKGLYVCLAKAAGYKFNDIQKLLDSTREVKKPITKIKGSKIKLGSTVKVVDFDKCFSSYSNWFIENNQHELGTHFIQHSSLCESTAELFKVVAIGKHCFLGEITICAIQPIDGKQVYLIDAKGLKLVNIKHYK